MAERRAFITVRSQFIALHAWQGAPERVSFLAFPHRHIFQVKVHINVGHHDRDAEFFLVKERLDSVLSAWQPVSGKLRDAGGMSCEMFADQILTSMRMTHPRTFMVEVSEDGENSATVVHAEELGA